MQCPLPYGQCRVYLYTVWPVFNEQVSCTSLKTRDETQNMLPWPVANNNILNHIVTTGKKSSPWLVEHTVQRFHWSVSHPQQKHHASVLIRMHLPSTHLNYLSCNVFLDNVYFFVAAWPSCIYVKFITNRTCNPVNIQRTVFELIVIEGR